MTAPVRRFFTSGLGLMLLAASVYSISDVLMKSLSLSFPASGIAFIRFLLGALVLWPIISSRQKTLKGNPIWMLILRGLMGSLSFFCILKSMAMIPLANTMVLFYTFPLFVALFSFLLYGERVGRWELLLILIGVIGIYIVVNPHSYHFNVGYVFALLAGSIGALAMVFTHELRKTNGPLIIYFYFCLVGGVLSLPFYGMDFRLPDLQQLFFLILVGIISLIGQLLMNQGFKYCKAAEGSAILMAEVVFAGIAGTVIFRDPLTLNFLTGALFVIGSGVGLNLLYRRPRTPSVPPKD